MRLIIIVLAGMLIAAFSGGPARSGEAVRFTAMEATTVRVYYATRPVVWTGIPSDVARELERGKPLPRSIAPAPLPADLLARLKRRHGFTYMRVADDILLIDQATRIVVDMIENVFG